MPAFMCEACICCYSGCDFEDITIGCEGEGQELCLIGRSCCMAGKNPYEVGLNKTSDNGICMISLYCCELGLKVPTTCCESQAKCLCMRQAAAFPFTGPVPAPVCACCAFQCAPNSGCMQPMPPMTIGAGGAPAAEEMEC